MARPTHSGVTVYNFDPKVQARTGKRKPYVIRWRVGGKQSYKSFQYVAEARQFHARLLTAASNGEQFDPATKLPTSWGTPNALTVAEVAYKWFRENYLKVGDNFETLPTFLTENDINSFEKKTGEAEEVPAPKTAPKTKNKPAAKKPVKAQTAKPVKKGKKK
jgi:hypothetical protein